MWLMIFKEDNGNWSWTRVFGTIALINALITCWTTRDLGMTSLWLGSAFGPKLIQKPFEVKRTLPCTQQD